jgi:hypothetical protein
LSFIEKLEGLAPHGRTKSRRLRTRYILGRELRFSYRKGSSMFLGSGRTKDLSNDGIRFETDHEVPRNSEIELRISWPVRLQDVCPLELVVRGPVLRTDNHGSVLKVQTCEFQTCGTQSFESAESHGRMTCSVVA